MTIPNRDPTEIELRRYWDALVTDGRSAADPPSINPRFVTTIRLLYAIDDAPAPDAALKNRIWEELMNIESTPITAPNGLLPIAAVTPEARQPGRAAVTRSWPGARRRWPRLAELATAAILLLTVTLGVLVYRAAGPPSERQIPAGLPFVAASPGPSPTWAAPEPEDCQVEPRSLASIRRLNEEATELRSRSIPDVPDTSQPVGTPADATVVTAIDEVYRQFSACTLADDFLRSTALFTDAALVHSIARRGPFSPDQLLALATPEAGLESELLPPYGPVPADAVSILADGRVGVLSPSLLGDADDPSSPYREYTIFAEVDGRYLIDEQFAVAIDATPRASMGDVATPTPETDESSIMALEATITALSTEVAAGAVSVANTGAETAAISTLEPSSIEEDVQVTPDALLSGDATAETAAVTELRRVVDRYDMSGCQVGFALISGNSSDIGEGVALAGTIEQLLQREFPEMFSQAGTELFAQPGAVPRGKVTLELYFYEGCKPVSPGPAATP